MNDKRILVIGCGVAGLTSGITLQENGYEVEIAAASIPPYTTSDVATAYWYPFRVYPPERVLPWASVTYEKYMDLSKIPGIGVGIFNFIQLFDREVEDPFWKPVVREFRRTREEELLPGYIDGYVAKVARIETPVYMKYLFERFQNSGGVINKLDKEIESIDEVSGGFGLVVNCTGLGAGKLCDDNKVYPIRGQLVKVSNPGLQDCLNEEEGPLAVSYIVPHGSYCILGGTAQDNNWNLDIDPQISDEILHKCRTLEPKLNQAQVLGHRVGLRPGRSEVRLELERLPDGTDIIHNYGHGGAGFTLSWGCAEQVHRLVSENINC